VKGTLLLNASYEPLCVVPMKGAVVLVLAEKAEILEAGGGVVRSESTALPIPSVIRLTTYVRVPYRARLPLTRRALLARDSHRCSYCTRSADTVDHVVPRSRGGRHEWENVVAACRICNGRKGDRLLAELGWALRITPTVPRGTRWLVVGVGRIDPSWEPYLAQAA
jgi:5-methylcytosine-specific restriction endonuclease McrA